MRQLNATYQIWPPYKTPERLEPTKPSIEVIFDLEIPFEIWTKYQDNEDKLMEWAVKYIFETRIKEVRREK